MRNLHTLALIPVLAALATPPSSQANVARELGKTFADAVDKAMPAVVVVRTQSVVYDRDYHPFWGHVRVPKALAGQASGVIIDKDGYVLTNNHVINDADEIEVVLHDGTKYNAEVVGRYQLSDLALVKIRPEKPTTFKTIEVADSDLIRVGEYVIAIGSPFSLDGSVTVGNISHKNRGSELAPHVNFIQTDAAINPGNSGGALIDVDGKLVGINTMIQTGSPLDQSYAGVGFAIPINYAIKIAESLKNKAPLERAWIGIAPQEFLRDDIGLYVAKVFPGTPAKLAGLKDGDIISQVEGKRITTIHGLQRAVFNKKIGEPIKLHVQRNKEELEIEIVTQAMPDQANLN